MFKLISLNLNGVRSASNKGLEPWLVKQQADCICVQELKAQEADMKGVLDELAQMKGYFHYAQKKGYSGVGVYTRHEPSDVIVGCGSEEFDAEGRYIELRFDSASQKKSIISAYFPSGSSGDDRQEAKYRFLDHIYPHLDALRNEREFVVCCDLNIAHKEQDLKNFKGNKNNSGFLPQERDWLTQLIEKQGVVDVYRHLYPRTTDECHTWWSNRGQAYAKNVGWRLDYQLATTGIANTVVSAEIYKEEKFSDHAPLIMQYEKTAFGI